MILGVFQAAIIHYVIAKIFGSFIFGRGWCGYACWNAMIFDLLPYKIPKAPRKKNLGFIRYIMFVLSLAFGVIIFEFEVDNIEKVMLWSFIIGNLFYYIIGVVLH